MGKLIDMTGQRCGNLVVIEQALSKNGRAMWKCKCDCGNEIITSGKYLRSHHTMTCGHCGRDTKVINEIGNRYGKLSVIERFKENKNNRATWVCQCDCGNMIVVEGQLLRKGEVKSCGKCCKNKEKIIDEVGNKYGYLTVIELASNNKEGAYWRCKCLCGNIVTVKGSKLRNGHTTSCGCIKSKGETKIIELLSNYNISFETQKIFDTCRFPKTNGLAKFDFYINNKYLIEYDGEQHFNYKNSGWDTEDNFRYTQERDRYKNEWCKENNIPLIRIPYTHLKDLCIEDLLLETSIYII